MVKSLAVVISTLMALQFGWGHIAIFRLEGESGECGLIDILCITSSKHAGKGQTKASADVE